MLIVKKFGGSSVANKERIFNVANRVAEEYRKGNQVVVVWKKLMTSIQMHRSVKWICC